jgi:hypothetical protein
MFAAGLRSDDLALAAGADWVAEQVVAGQREFGLDAIQDAVSNRRLRAGPTRTIVSIATLAPDRLAAQAAHAIDWGDRFDGPDAYARRRPKPPATWQQLQADIEDIPAQPGAASHVAITGSLRLAPAFTVGAALRMITSTDITVMQHGERAHGERFAGGGIAGRRKAGAAWFTGPAADRGRYWWRTFAQPCEPVVPLGAG